MDALKGSDRCLDHILIHTPTSVTNLPSCGSGSLMYSVRLAQDSGKVAQLWDVIYTGHMVLPEFLTAVVSVAYFGVTGYFTLG